MIGQVNKLASEVNAAGEVQYFLPLGEERIACNDWLGKTLTLIHSDQAINCIGCGVKVKKTYQQGYCFPCTQRLARCDLCIVKPERCHFHQGTCREPEWGQQHCMQAHYVYLANSSGLKVGITRGSNVPYRWVDQGASQGLLIAQVSHRRVAGLIEVALAQHVADKTNWRKMLQGEPGQLDLPGMRDTLLRQAEADLKAAQHDLEEEDVLWLPDEQVLQLHYPVTQYPEKIHSYNLDKTPEITDQLVGIKGQYFIFANGVLNIRKFGGYHLQVHVSS